MKTFCFSVLCLVSLAAVPSAKACDRVIAPVVVQQQVAVPVQAFVATPVQSFTVVQPVFAVQAVAVQPVVIQRQVIQRVRVVRPVRQRSLSITRTVIR